MRNLTLLALWVPPALAVVAFLAFALPCRIRLRWKFAWLAALVVCSLRLRIFRWISGGVAVPDWPLFVIAVFDWAYCGGIVLVPLSLVWWGRKWRHVVLPAIAWGIAAVGVWNAYRTPCVKEVTLEYPDLPPSLDGYRIVQLADIHVNAAAPRGRTEKIVAIANSLSPDLVCLTGDNADGSPAARSRDLEPIRFLRAKDGVWGVSGNHEYQRRRAIWRPVYKKWGIRLLENECVFPRKGLALGGVNDDAAARCRAISKSNPYYDSGPAPSVAAAFAAATNGEFRILMQHQPRHARDNVSGYGVKLQLSGHTHGGLAPLVSIGVMRRSRGFLRGEYDLGPGKLYVSAGLGQWQALPMRLLDPTEVTLIVLRRR